MHMEGMLKYCLVFLCLSLVGACISTETDITSTKVFEEEGFNRGDKILPTDDGFLILGYSHIGNAYELWLLKITENKKELWRKEYKFKEEYVLPCELLKVEDGYLIFGQIENDKEKTSEMVLLKTDERGNKQWQRYYTGGTFAMARSILSVEDGFILMGTAAIENSEGENYLYPLVLKTDEEGSKQWQKTYGEGDQIGHAICKTVEGYLIVGGKNSANEKELRIIKIDKNGEEKWSKTYKKTGVDWVLSIFPSKGGYTLAGYTSRHEGDFFLMKLDEMGNKQWLKRYDNEDEFPKGTIRIDDRFVMAGATFPEFNAEKNIFIIETDGEGNERWRKVYKYEKDQIAYSVCEGNGTLFVVGFTTTEDEGDLFLIEIKRR